MKKSPQKVRRHALISTNGLRAKRRLCLNPLANRTRFPPIFLNELTKERLHSGRTIWHFGPAMSTLTNAEKEISNKAAGTTFQLAWGIISNLGKKAWDRATLQHSMKRYCDRYLRR